MEVIIDKNITLYPQIKGLGEIVSSFNLVVNIAGVLDMKDDRHFILSIRVKANNYVYNYSNIYTPESVQPNGDIVVGAINIIGEADVNKMDIAAKIIYIDNSAY